MTYGAVCALLEHSFSAMRRRIALSSEPHETDEGEIDCARAKRWASHAALDEYRNKIAQQALSAQNHRTRRCIFREASDPARPLFQRWRDFEGVEFA